MSESYPSRGEIVMVMMVMTTTMSGSCGHDDDNGLLLHETSTSYSEGSNSTHGMMRLFLMKYTALMVSRQLI